MQRNPSFPTAQLTSPIPVPATNQPVISTAPTIAPTTLKTNLRNTAHDTLSKVVQAITDFNAQTSSVHDKWAFSQSILARVSGCNQPAAQKFWAQNKSQLDAYNQAHGLPKSHNLAKAKRKGSKTIEEDLIPFLAAH